MILVALNISGQESTGINIDHYFSPCRFSRIGEMVKLFVDAGIIVLTAFISPFRADRERIHSLFSPGEFIEVYTSCPVEVCSLPT